MNIVKLSEIPWFISKISDIHLREWGWYYKEECNIDTKQQLIDYIYDNYRNKMYIILTESYDLIGTALIIDSNVELKNYSPWISCLYITNEYKDKEEYYSKKLVDYFNTDDLYMWCYKENDINKYLKLGFKKIKEYMYNNNIAYILKKEEFVIR